MELGAMRILLLRLHSRAAKFKQCFNTVLYLYYCHNGRKGLNLVYLNVAL